MAEQRLIDANEAHKRLLSYYSFVNENTNKSNYTGETLMSYEVMDMIEDCIEGIQTVNPETLPIVQKLREELERVTAERDAAVKDINEILSLTELCPIQCEWCRWNEGCDSSKTPEWRGAKEALKGEQNG